MTKTASNPTTPRRSLLAMAPFVLAASGPAIAATSVGVLSRDAELIETCQRFAENEFDAWYHYVVTNDRSVEAHYEDSDPDWATLRWIEATPAHTPAGCQAKALAFVAWHRDAYDDSADDRNGHTGLLASLMRDLAAPARAAIIAHLVAQYGPLPAGYSTDGMWLGSAVQ